MPQAVTTESPLATGIPPPCIQTCFCCDEAGFPATLAHWQHVGRRSGSCLCIFASPQIESLDNPVLPTSARYTFCHLVCWVVYILSGIPTGLCFSKCKFNTRSKYWGRIIATSSPMAHRISIFPVTHGSPSSRAVCTVVTPTPHEVHRQTFSGTVNFEKRSHLPRSRAMESHQPHVPQGACRRSRCQRLRSRPKARWVDHISATPSSA
jgi:hypothetical protein